MCLVGWNIKCAIVEFVSGGTSASVVQRGGISSNTLSVPCFSEYLYDGDDAGASRSLAQDSRLVDSQLPIKK